MLELLSSIVGANKNNTTSSAQKKKRKSNSITPGPSSLDEENVLNVSTNVPSKSSPSPVKKAKVTKMEDCTVPSIDTDTQKLKISCPPKPSPNMSEAGTEISSVSERREWLKQFEKKQASNVFRSIDKEKATRQNDDRNNNETRFTDMNKERREPPPPPVNSSLNTNGSSAPIMNHSSVLNSSGLKPMSAKKPRKPRPVVNRRASSGVPSWAIGASTKEDVKASDDGYASVASLSKWLENDPTSAKKKRHVRRGRNIVSRSRQFENGREDLIVEAKISRGAVGDKKKWLQEAFQSKGEEDEDDACSSFSGYVRSEVGRSARYAPRFNRQGAQTEIITDDAASSLSVADKKDWLKKAFVKNSEDRKNLGYNKAQTDVMHNRGQDEAVSRAKLRFKERSARKLMAATSTRPSGRPASSASSNNSNEVKFVEVEEDKTPVDFSAARDFLVQRSNKNGHDTQVLNKVSLRKKNIERQVDDSRRKSMGLVLKPSWDLSEGNTYEKKYVPVTEIAPKKSFEELP